MSLRNFYVTLINFQYVWYVNTSFFVKNLVCRSPSFFFWFNCKTVIIVIVAKVKTVLINTIYEEASLAILWFRLAFICV